MKQNQWQGITLARVPEMHLPIRNVREAAPDGYHSSVPSTR